MRVAASHHYLGCGYFEESNFWDLINSNWFIKLYDHQRTDEHALAGVGARIRSMVRTLGDHPNPAIGDHPNPTARRNDRVATMGRAAIKVPCEVAAPCSRAHPSTQDAIDALHTRPKLLLFSCAEGQAGERQPIPCRGSAW
jgi:hypothetical protein